MFSRLDFMKDTKYFPSLSLGCSSHCVYYSLSHVQLFAAPLTVACQTPMSMGFSRQEHWSGLPFLFQGIFLTKGLNPGLLHCRQILYYLSPKGSSSHYDNIIILIYHICKNNKIIKNWFWW